VPGLKRERDCCGGAGAGRPSPGRGARETQSEFAPAFAAMRAESANAHWRPGRLLSGGWVRDVDLLATMRKYRLPDDVRVISTSATSVVLIAYGPKSGGTPESCLSVTYNDKIPGLDQ